MAEYTFIDYSAEEFGVNAVLGTASTNSNPVAIAGADLVELHVQIVNANAAVFKLTGTHQKRSLQQDNTYGEWETMQTRGISSGTETWSNRTIAKSTPATAATYNYVLPIEDIAPSDQYRVISLTDANAGATSTLTIWARVRIPKA